ncbi:unnamed protein product [Rotaria sp. Silwood1]|nr:unnamed protein product [Rotaria sp. Silwood1]
MGTSLLEYTNPPYLSDISEEPKQLLEPISGYAHESLLPLEEACEPLLNIVPSLPAHIWIAKQNSKNPPNDLTQDESAAIPLAKIPAAPRQTVWRGLHLDLSKDCPPGEKITWWAFSSCTTSLRVLESDLYLGNVGTRTLFSIETINGRTIRSHSHFTTEDEILLLPGTFLEVKSQLNPAPDLHIIHLQQRIPPHVLLEPPFEGAELFPLSEVAQSLLKNTEPQNKNDDSRRWYKNNKIRFGIGAILAVIILAIVLGATLGSRTRTQTGTSSIPTSTTTEASPFYGGSPPDPVSVANAFYAFDGNMLDLYSHRNGEVVGGSVSYVQGYVAYGQAVVLTQSIPTLISIKPNFDLNINSAFTIEGFFMLRNTQMNAILIQLTPYISLNLVNGVLVASLGPNITLAGTSVISTNQWHHFSFVCDPTQQTTTIYIDGAMEVTGSSIKSEISSNDSNSTIIIGSGFTGYIDQLSISLKAKSHQAVSWDATVVAYYPVDLSWLLDKGPNGINATASNVIPIYGWRYNALNFKKSGASYEANGFTVLGTPYHAFSIALWVRAEAQSGVFLTVANPYTCLLVLGFQNDSNTLVAYLPNATASGRSVNIIGPQMPSNAWVHVAFTWSAENRAKLYTSSYLQGTSGEASLLNNARGDQNSSPMTITLGTYNGAANCDGIEGIPISQTFTGSIRDEPKQLLQLISSYDHEPLLNIVSRLPVHMWIAKQNPKNSPDDLTQDGSATIRLYTMEWDSDSSELSESLYLFLTALAEISAAPRQTVWRGLRLDLSKDCPPGEKITWWAFSSCTTSLRVLESDLYLGNIETRTLFSIETINSRTVRSHSHFTTEDEILLLPGIFLEVKSQLNPAPDLHIIHLQQQIPPHVLLELPFEKIVWCCS